KGGNYGWNVKEGSHCFDTDSDLLERSSCPVTDSAGKPLIDPIIELVNSANPKGGGIALTIIGGYVYRGTAVSSLQGKYIFGTFSQNGQPNAKVYMATNATTGPWPWQELTLKGFQPNLGMYLKGFGQDQSGEVYLATSSQLGISGTTGKIYKLINQ
ncbi:MAG: hypothetical protein ACJ748_05755, partial [Flavisolibacter sp.]